MSHSAASSARRTDIEGLRALAIGLVVVSHTSIPILRGGFVGVDIFFVLSGFLITSHLAASLRRHGRVSFVDFYARRARRILPAALLVAAVTLVAGTLVLPPLALADLAEMARAVVFFVPNLQLAFEHVDYSSAHDPSPFQQFWSLGVEEQFYLVFPAVLAVLFAVAKSKTRFVVGGLAVLSGVSFVAAVILLRESPTWAFFSLPSRAWEFGFGALASIAVAGRAGTVLARSPRVVGHVMATAGFLLIAGGALLFDDSTPFPGPAALPPVAGTTLLVLAGSTSVTNSPVQRLVATRPFQYLGGISYSLYLWHWPLLALPAWAVIGVASVPGWAQGVALVVALVLAELTRRFVERPFLRARPPGVTKRRRSRVLAGSAVLTIAAIAVGASFTKGLQDHAVLAGRDNLPVPTPTATPQFSSFVPSNVSPHLDRARATATRATTAGCHIGDSRKMAVNDCVFGDPDGATTVVLFGDSHAEHWLTGLETWAAVNGVRVRSWTKAGCSATDLRFVIDDRPFVECDRWRDSVFRAIERERPEVVVLSSANHLRFDTRGQDVSSARAGGIERTVKRISRSSAVLALADTPAMRGEAPVCLSAHLDRADLCATPRADAIDQLELDAQRSTYESLGARFVDLNDYFCSATSCGSVIGNTLLYRDTSHLTPAWSKLLAPALGAALRRALP